MTRKELLDLIKQGPIRITMNDGQSYDVPNIEFALVGDISVSVLVKDEEDGKWRHCHLPLVTIASVKELQAQA